MLREANHRVRIDVEYGGESADLLIAIHAWRSAASILRYRDRYPGGPLVVCLGGTDVNTFLKSHSETTLRSMEMADALICLHDLIGEALPAQLRAKLHVVYQSALPLSGPRRPARRNFDVCVIGHLRDVKDPFRAALAARQLPADSRIRVIHLGKAHTAEFASQAKNPTHGNQLHPGRWRQRDLRGHRSWSADDCQPYSRKRRPVGVGIPGLLFSPGRSGFGAFATSRGNGSSVSRLFRTLRTEACAPVPARSRANSISRDRRFGRKAKMTNCRLKTVARAMGRT